MSEQSDGAPRGADPGWGSVAAFACQSVERAELAIRHLFLKAHHATVLRAPTMDEACTVILHLGAVDSFELHGVAGLRGSGRRLPGAVDVVARREALTLKSSHGLEALILGVPCLSVPRVAPDARAGRGSGRTEAHDACDPVGHALGRAFLAAVEPAAPSHALAADHLARALCCHFAFKHAWVRETFANAGQCGLAPWQARKAARLLGRGDVQVHEVATACRLSASAFSRLFRATFLCSPHAWRAERRIDAVKALLLEADLSLADAALQAGFADQASMTRAFRRLVGASPGAWRTSRREGEARPHIAQELPT